MNILVIGSGAREHAIAWKLTQSARIKRVFVAPGNAGTAADAENVAILPHRFQELIRFARDADIDLTIVGPEAPLADGIVDAFQEAKLRIFGPSKAAAQLEGSKVFCKKLLREAGIPTADFRVFSDPDEATKYVWDRYPTQNEEVPVVVKADGLAAGKGVIVCSRRDEVLEAIDQIARQRVFGDAGRELVIEERLDGQEASVQAITDGRTILTLPSSQDHKPAYDDDRGPNTGGMGAYCPAPLVNDEMLRWIEAQVLLPTVVALKRKGITFQGVLYAGLMITRQGPKVLEFNVRFGDPECQSLLMRLKTDLADVLEAAAQRRLDRIGALDWDPRPAVCVVMASEGYPGDYEKGRPIRGLEQAAQVADAKVFHAGTAHRDGQVVTAGGRVLAVTALGDSIATAKRQAYTAVKCIRWSGAWCRKDISDKALTH